MHSPFNWRWHRDYHNDCFLYESARFSQLPMSILFIWHESIDLDTINLLLNTGYSIVNTFFVFSLQTMRWRRSLNWPICKIILDLYHNILLLEYNWNDKFFSILAISNEFSLFLFQYYVPKLVDLLRAFFVWSYTNKFAFFLFVREKNTHS